MGIKMSLRQHGRYKSPSNKCTNWKGLPFAPRSLPFPLLLLCFYLRCGSCQNGFLSVNRRGPYAKTLDMNSIPHLSSVEHDVMRHKMANLGLRFGCQLALFHDGAMATIITRVSRTVVLDVRDAQDTLLMDSGNVHMIEC